MWTNEIIESMRDLAGHGYPASQIAAALAKKFQISATKNSVIGKCRREQIFLGRIKPVAIRSQTVIVAPRSVSHSSLKTVATEVSVAKIDAPSLKPPPTSFACIEDKWRSYGRINLVDLCEWHCRFVLGDPRRVAYDPIYCGEHRIAGKSYCEEHAKRTSGRPA